MGQNILADVGTCLRNAMDAMFNSDQSITIPESSTANSGMMSTSGPLSADALKSVMNKRKLASNGIGNEAEVYQENGNDHTKRLCTTNGHRHEQKT